MAILINWKICDNAKECLGIDSCPTGALYWDKDKKGIGMDNSKCTNCGLCEKACEVGAIRVARTDEEYKKIQEGFDKDPRKRSDLYVDRYGAMPVTKAFQMEKESFDLEVLGSNKPVLLEFYTEEGIECLISSIPIKIILGDKQMKYRKFEVEPNDELRDKYGIENLPCLAFFDKGKLVGKIEGYFSWDDKAKLDEKLKEITLLR